MDKTHNKKLAEGLVWRRYNVDDDFNADAEGQTGQERDVYFKDFRAKDFEIVVVEEEDNSLFEQLTASLRVVKQEESEGEMESSIA